MRLHLRFLLVSALLCVASLGLRPPFALAAPHQRTSCPNRRSEEWYRVVGHPESDGCRGAIHLATRHLRLSGSSLFADVVDRVYALEQRGRHVIAHGQFPASTGCQSSQIDETWDLERVDANTLEGTLRSTWRLPPHCAPCTITFRLRATRTAAPRHTR